MKHKARVINVKKPLRTVAPADPTLWGEKSQGSPSAWWTKQYTDIHYRCSNCRKACIFTADDQKYTYETKKAPIDQQRFLCETCWKLSHVFAADIKLCQEQWAESKPALMKDAGFLSTWFALLAGSEKFCLKPNSATKAMLQKLLLKIDSEKKPV